MIKTKSIKKLSPANNPGGSSAKKKMTPISEHTISKLPKYNFGTTMAGVGASFGVDKNLKWKDYTGTQKAGTIGSAGASVAGTGLSMAGDIVSAYDKNPNRFDKSDATASTLKGIGSGAAAGVSAGMVFGPVGGAIGGIVGGIAGAFGSSRANKAAYAAQKKEDRINSITDAAQQASTIGINNGMNNRKSKNLGMPGFNKGVYKFYSNKDNEPNARVASEEAIVDPNGSVGIVPGKYTGKDNTLASIQDGSTILPKDKYFTLPDGKSTPADIGKRASKIQSKAKDVLGLRNTSSINRKTSELNLKNADEVLDSVSMYAESLRNMQKTSTKSKLPGYKLGVSDFYNDGSVMLNEISATANRIVKPTTIMPKNTVPSDMIKYPIGVGASRRMQASTSDQFINSYKSEFDSELLKSNNDSTAAYHKLAGKYGAVKTGAFSRKLPGYIDGEDEFKDQQLKEFSITANRIHKPSPKKPRTVIPSDMIKYPVGTGASRTVISSTSDQFIKSIKPEFDKELLRLGNDSLAAYENLTRKHGAFKIGAFARRLPGYIEGEDDFKEGGKGGRKSIDMNDITKASSIATAIGGSLAQYNNATPETISPEQYTANKYQYRSNLFNQLRDIQAKENIARYNNRVIGSNAGSASAMNSALNRNTNAAFASAYDADNRARMQIGDMNMRELARVNNLNVNEKIRVKGINMRNAAAARNIKYAAIQDIAKTILPRQYSQYDKG